MECLAGIKLREGKPCSECGATEDGHCLGAESRYMAARLLAGKQAGDDGLWFEAKTAPEAYLQQELRRLHAAIEEPTQP